MLICPNCRKILNKTEGKYVCKKNHSFDISKSSHINLLITNKHGDNIGDSKEMVRARAEFLDKGYYRPLAEKICKLLPQKENITYLDCGCGQGFYSKIISNNLKNSIAYATDISKHAVIHASKRDKNTQYFVGNVFDLPILEASVDLLTCIFAPLANVEFERVLKHRGSAIIVVAGSEHLFELKEAVYATPYKNDEDKHDFHGLQIVKKEKLSYKATIETNEDIKNLFSMTPYAMKTSKEDMKKLDSLSDFEVTLDFVIYILQKQSKKSTKSNKK